MCREFGAKKSCQTRARLYGEPQGILGNRAAAHLGRQLRWPQVNKVIRHQETRASQAQVEATPLTEEAARRHAGQDNEQGRRLTYIADSERRSRPGRCFTAS